jgi:hypothetical protein
MLTMKGVAMVALLLAMLAFCGCSTNNPGTPSSVVQGPDGTIAYDVLVETSEPGVRIEANQDYIGTTPLTLRIFGDKDGTFHNFGSPEYIVRALPVRAGQYPQTKVFRTGKWFAPEDMIPKRLFFDMGQPAPGTGASPQVTPK